jgi:ankyrin repeat protein
MLFFVYSKENNNFNYILSGFLDICKFLVSKNAKIDIKDDKSKTPIDHASLSQNEAILEFLIKSKK